MKPHQPSRQAAVVAPTLARPRWQRLGALLLVLVEAGSMLALALVHGRASGGSRLALGVLLASYVFRGATWARWLAVALLLVAIGMDVWLLGVGRGPHAILLPVLVGQALTVLVLVFGPRSAWLR